MGNRLLNEEYFQNLPKSVVENLQAQNRFIIETIAKRIRDIETLSPSDAHRLSAAYYAGGDMKKINKEISRITGLNLREIDKIYQATGEENAGFQKAFYDFRGVPFIPYAQNDILQNMVKAMAQVTKDEYINLSRTAGFITREGKPLSIRQQYVKAVDRAITAVSTGTIDYQGAMRETVKEMAQSGYRTINYESGYSRRLDTAVRQNILTGVKDISQQMQHQTGEQLGCDGYEVSYHANPRPSHAAMGGSQYSKAEFYAQGIDALLADYNCRHIAFDIIMGVSEPNFTKSELAAMKSEDARAREWQGKPITGYEATQKQRKYETAIRHLKDEANACRVAGDALGQMRVQSKINSVSAEYSRFSKAVGLSVKDNRTAVDGFKGVRTRAQVLTTQIKNIVTSNGIKVTQITEHAIGQAAARDISLTFINIQNALTKPLSVGKIKVDKLERPSQRFVGNEITIAVNNETGAIVTVWNTGTDKIKKYGGENSENKL